MAKAVVSGDQILNTPWLAAYFQGAKIAPDARYDMTIEKHGKKRSIDANAYMWSLIGKISEEIHLSRDAIYRQYVRDYGICREMEMTEAEYNFHSTAWHKIGTGWITDVIDVADGDKLLVRFYYGSSVYSVKQMSRLIEAIVQDCKDMGIETRSDAEIRSLLERWTPKNG